MPAEFYKLVHLAGVFMVVAGFGAAVALSVNGVAAKGSAGRALAVITHGVGLLLVLLGGFGMQARLGLPFAGWLYAKIVIWLALGGLLTLALRKREAAKPLWFGVLALTLLAAYLGIYKPV